MLTDLLNHLYEFSPAQIAGFISFFFIPNVLIPFLVKEHAPNWVRSVLLLVLTALTVALSGLVSFQNLDLGSFAQAWFVAFIAAIGSYLGLWKPTAIAKRVSIATDPASIIGRNAAEPDEFGVYNVSDLDLDALPLAEADGPGADGAIEG